MDLDATGGECNLRASAALWHCALTVAQRSSISLPGSVAFQGRLGSINRGELDRAVANALRLDAQALDRLLPLTIEIKLANGGQSSSRRPANPVADAAGITYRSYRGRCRAKTPVSGSSRGHGRMRLGHRHADSVFGRRGL